MRLIERLAEVGKRSSDSIDIDGLVELIESVPRVTDERIGEIEDLVERMDALLPHNEADDEADDLDLPSRIAVEPRALYGTGEILHVRSEPDE